MNHSVLLPVRQHQKHSLGLTPRCRKVGERCCIELIKIVKSINLNAFQNACLNCNLCQNQFGELLQTALIEPVCIEKNGRELAYVISSSEYRRLREAIVLSRVELDGFLAAMDSPRKPNAAFKRAAKNHGKLIKAA